MSCPAFGVEWRDYHEMADRERAAPRRLVESLCVGRGVAFLAFGKGKQHRRHRCAAPNEGRARSVNMKNRAVFIGTCIMAAVAMAKI